MHRYITAQFNQSRVEYKYIIKHSHSSHAMSPSLYDKAPEMLIGIAYAQKPHFNTNADVSRGAIGLNFGPSIHLLPYFVYVSSEGSGEPAHFGAGSLEPSLLAYSISIKSSCSGSLRIYEPTQ